MAGMELKYLVNSYAGKRVLVTGHNGFKGSWLVACLERMGASLFGVALPPNSEDSHWAALNVELDERNIDIRDTPTLKKFVDEINPEIVFHLAAQPLVLESYKSPLETWSTNVVGTASVLEACRGAPALKAIIVVTTDKCYRNESWVWGYRENDALGGHDPYSASKAGTELVAASYRDCFFSEQGAPLLATARAGNVIGGGDWSENRLIPDMIRAIRSGESLEVRSPRATRPWQHVLDCLSGYLVLGKDLLAGNTDAATSYNFGPSCDSNKAVEDILYIFKKTWAAGRWHVYEDGGVTEARMLHLDSSKATKELGWSPLWSLDKAVDETARWYRNWLETGHAVTGEQIDEYFFRETH